MISLRFQRDLSASIVVFFVAVPLCLGIALASGAPLFSGLIAGIVGGLLVGALSGSALGVSGPAAGLAVIVLHAIEALGSFQALLLSIVLAGGIQILLGLARAGLIAYFFPSAVIKGMLSGIGLLIVLKQIPHALGHDSDPEGDEAFLQSDGDTTLSSLQSMLDDFSIGAVVLSVIAMGILVLWDRLLKHRHKLFEWIQAPLVVVLFGIAYELITRRYLPELTLSREHLVAVPVIGGFSELGDLITLPDFSRIAEPLIWTTAITMAIVASLETLLCVEATDKLDPEKRTTPANRELFAQGLGNVVSGLIGGLPVTQVIVRSSANIQSGGQTKAAAILHGTWILLFAVALPSVLNLIPLAALACILIVVGLKLAKPRLFLSMYRLGWQQFLPFVVTVVGILATDLLTGIALGLGVSLFVILKSHYLNSHLLESQERDGRTEVRLVLASEVSYLHKAALLEDLAKVPDGARVVIDASRSARVDHDVLEVLAEFEATKSRRGLEVVHLGDLELPTSYGASH